MRAHLCQSMSAISTACCLKLGVYKDLAKVEMLVDISHVAELQKIEVN